MWSTAWHLMANKLASTAFYFLFLFLFISTFVDVDLMVDGRIEEIDFISSWSFWYVHLFLLFYIFVVCNWKSNWAFQMVFLLCGASMVASVNSKATREGNNFQLKMVDKVLFGMNVIRTILRHLRIKFEFWFLLSGHHHHVNAAWEQHKVQNTNPKFIFV